jgi:hypothetical protein
MAKSKAKGKGTAKGKSKAKSSSAKPRATKSPARVSNPKKPGKKPGKKSGKKSAPRRSNPKPSSSKSYRPNCRSNPIDLGGLAIEAGAFGATFVGLDYLSAVVLDTRSRLGMIGAAGKAGLGVLAGWGLSKTKFGKRRPRVCLAIALAGIAQGITNLSAQAVAKLPKPAKPLLNLSGDTDDELDALAKSLSNAEQRGGVSDIEIYRPSVNDIELESRPDVGEIEDSMMPSHWGADGLPSYMPSHWS